MTYVIPLWQPPSLAVAGTTDRFPVRRIYCIGRNYAEHVREMGGDPSREPPIFFTKPADALVPDQGTVPYPPATRALHYEVELVVALGQGGRNVAPERALDLVFGYAVGLDLTRRDLQAEAKAKGQPWDMAKGFDGSAPCGVLQPASAVGHPERGAIWLKVNDVLRQQGDLADMIWSVPRIVAALSGLVELAAGDLIFTGTPEGVGPLEPGDRLHAHIDGVGGLSVTIGAPIG